MFWRFYLGLWLFAVLATPLFAIEPERHPALVTILLVTFGIGFLICFLVVFVASHFLIKFRCPRCG